MTFKDLIKQGKIKPIKASDEEIKEILALSDRDIKMYDTVGLITETEIRELYKKSKEFVALIKNRIKI